MRVRTDFWVKAYLRRRFGEGLAGGVTRHGDDMAGAIYIKINRLDGTVALFGPAPQSLDAQDLERRWAPAHKAQFVPEAEADATLARASEFDSDLWVIEIEDRAGRHGLEGWLAEG